MTSNALLLATALFASSANPVQDAGKETSPSANRVKTTIKTEKNGDMFLIHETTLNAPVAKVWDAYTTSEGWKSWVAPVAKVDLKIGGLIKTNYRKGGKLTDEDAITLHIINYVPQRALTFQAELGKNFPAILKSREKQMFNLLTFEPIGKGKTKLVSYGIGYKDSPELQAMMKFFVKANEDSLLQLIKYVETGEGEPHTLNSK
ncbi:MAG: SRPBCC domain-containing protein [Planctomycetaceae bacterium]